MPEAISETAPEQPKVPAGPKSSAPVDLSAEIIQAVDRQPGDQIKCTRITADTYRCNWWTAFTDRGYDNPGMSGLLVTTHRVRKSKFLHVSKSSGKLVITEHSRS